MAVLRVVPNIATAESELARRFYGDILGMSLAKDHGWIVTFAAPGHAAPQVSFATEGGSGTPVPDLSVEVDDFEAVLERLQAAEISVVYGPAQEPWGVTRVFVRDPFGRLVNVLTHGSRSP